MALGFVLLAGCDSKPGKTTTKEAHSVRYEKARNKEVQRIDSLENLIRQEVKQQKDPDVRLAMYAIQAYQYFAADYPKDTLAPNYLFKAGQLYEGVLRNPEQAVKQYEKVYDKYPEFDKRGMSLFLAGNLYHTLNDTTKAIKAFETFRKDYPNHAFADDAAGMINLIRMSEAQQKEMFGGKQTLKPKKGV